MPRARGCWIVRSVSVLLACATVARAQPSVDAGPDRLPAASERWRDGLWNAVGPTAIAGSAVSAAWGQWVTEEPREWADDRLGHARGFGVASATTAVTEGSLALLAAAAHEDARYHRCPCDGFWPRTVRWRTAPRVAPARCS